MKSMLLGLNGGDVFSIINSAFFILGGIVVFMIGMNMMGHNIEKAAGKSMRSLMNKATKNRFLGVGTGAAVTALVNSSAATTVMIVGFVNVGLMTLTQAASVIMGANIGTTISALIMALSSAGGAQFSVAAVFAFVAFIGFVLTLVGKSDKMKQLGCILEGVGLIFIGLNVMSGAVHDLTSDYSGIDSNGVGIKNNISEVIKGIFVGLGNGKATLTWEVIVLFILGALLTAMMQSSAALTAIVISLASSGLISLQMAMCIILGANVGTCLTSVVSSIGANANAKRAAMVHLLFNVAGAIIFIFPVAFAGKYIAQFFDSFIGETQWQIAIFHIVFNVITTAALLPFIKYLVKLACLLVPEKAAPQEEERISLDVRLLKTPAIAVGQSRKQLLKMSDEAFSNYKIALNMLLTGDLSEREKFAETEEKINADNKAIISFLIRLSLTEISERDEKKISSFYHVASDIERIGDYAENLVEFAEKMQEDGVVFSDNAKDELREMDMHITNLYGYMCKVFSEMNLRYCENVEFEESETDRMNNFMQDAHLERMNAGKCTPEAGSLYMQIAVNMERIGDHMNNISNSVKAYGKYIPAESNA